MVALMAFEIIPAIDVAGGRLALHTPQGPVLLDAFHGDPLAAARACADAGARRVHVVDLDLAFAGAFANLDVVRGAAALGLRVQASGGIATLAEATEALGAGADRVVLGSGALLDERAAEEAIDALGRRLVVGIEVDEGRIRPRGRREGDLPLVETLGWLVAAGADAFLVTAVARVGVMRGPDLEIVRRVARAGRPVIAAGGVGSVDDLVALRGAGAVGAVVGRAALKGGLDLEDALARLRV
jgi:phosphoribosylformimino-5-aminoimidazole carboxamide ribonucleotide (ProFAR) isomerase